ncbi:cell division protein [Halogeometricum borinquense]|uniref:Tubulin-like protein CetZ n=2 Tax=Halogeometricum borinquense TaxID=60847 RepID=E4NRY0_HALBP|nr:tubulin/FtsZ family protein [Halogeometricum borinquense]ADQ68026.1 cell division GTPase [Halogeometricum borinquense DSM 11551]ELY24053.1 cell division GTPase [Halogeometricum borinquense DSM 11551]QIB73371.1 cell division protein [Halogeometricum borinquense]QIQ77230.1 cell division protein [Halogeometricum borinquense]RYJ13057.1 cell division protein [Halogeometricum borinquense]
MKTVLIGVGQAGGKLTRELVDFDERMEFGAVLDAVAVNSAKADLRDIPFETILIGQDRVKGHGVGGDNELGAEVMQADKREVLSALDGRITAEAEAIFVVAGLGGGTGSGGAPVLVNELQQIYDVPIYALGILPGDSEGAMYQVNAGRSLKTVAREADSLLLVDNDAFRSSGESLEQGYDAINRAIAQRVGLLFASGEAVEGVAESVVDSSEVINTLRSGGISALGYAAAESADSSEGNINTVMSTTRRSLLTGTSLPEATTADSALLVVAGEPDKIPRKGVERARRWIEEETGSLQVRGGDFPLDSGRIASLILLGGVERSDRLEAFMQRAKEAVKEAEETEEREDPAETWRNDELEDLI